MGRFFKKVIPTLPMTTPTPNNPGTPEYKISSKVKCNNCRKYFEPDDNKGPCVFHPKSPNTDGLRVHNEYDEFVHPCCGRIQKGFFPTLVEAPGCISYEKHEPI